MWTSNNADVEIVWPPAAAGLSHLFPTVPMRAALCETQFLSIYRGKKKNLYVNAEWLSPSFSHSKQPFLNAGSIL